MLYNPCEPNPVVLSLIKDGKQATSGSLFLFHHTETLEHVRPCTAALTGLRKSVISSGNMVYNCRPWSRLSDPPAIIEFGSFSILPHRRQLLADGRPIRLGGRRLRPAVGAARGARGSGQ
jgi:hypothetical protein